MKWIGVEERLPESGKDYLFYGKQVGRHICYYDEKLYMPWLSDVTHWMPLPEPPIQHER